MLIDTSDRYKTDYLGIVEERKLYVDRKSIKRHHHDPAWHKIYRPLFSTTYHAKPAFLYPVWRSLCL